MTQDNSAQRRDDQAGAPVFVDSDDAREPDISLDEAQGDDIAIEFEDSDALDIELEDETDERRRGPEAVVAVPVAGTPVASQVAPAAPGPMAPPGQATAAVAPAQRPPAQAGGSPWPARIVAGVTVVAILAILLAILLPRERKEVKPQAGPSSEQQTTATTPQPQPTITPQPATPSVPAPTVNAPQSQPSEQMGTCPRCGGSGWVACPFPAEMHTRDGRLLHPEGMGVPEGDELREDLTGNLCPYCGGTLKMRCPDCNGTGQVRQGAGSGGAGGAADPNQQAQEAVGAAMNALGGLGDMTGGGGQ